MNIFIPHKWLLEHLETTASPEDIATNLSLSGPSVEKIEELQGDHIYDIEVTTNRVDSTSVRGIAREAAAILPEFNIKSSLKPLNLDDIETKVTDANLPKLDFQITNDPKLCHRILAIKLSDVKVAESPKWLQDKLIQVGQRPLNNIIDITNYIMWDMGHPIHAFDYDLLKKKKIIVRTAKKGEKFTTLDNKQYQCVGGEVVFDDGTGNIVDLPGIMGTANTVVSEKTKNVLLWIESVDAVKIRFASMTHSIRSQAAVLNEKNVDPELGLPTILKAIETYLKVANANLGSQLVDIYPGKIQAHSVTLKQSDLIRYLGIDIPPTRVQRMLRDLEFKVTYSKTKKSFQVTPPSFRQKDIKIYQDVIEEVARIYGYHNLPSILMDTPIPDHPDPKPFIFENNIKSWLVGWGLQETYTYSMVSKELAKNSGVSPSDHLRIKNPLIDEWTYLRTSLIPSLVEVLENNPSSNTTLFELQNIYPKSEHASDLPKEQMQLGIVTNQPYIHIKGILDSLLQKNYISNIQISPSKYSKQAFDSEHVAKIMSEKTVLGYIGKVSNTDYYAIVINFSSLLKTSHTHPTTINLDQYPPIIEDLTFTLPDQTAVGPIISDIYTASDLIQIVTLKTTYHQNFTFAIQYRHPSRPLTDKEIDPIRKSIVQKLKKLHSANLVGKLI